jgi:hypothetical protein
MCLGIGFGKRRASRGVEQKVMKVLLLERDRATRSDVKVLLESVGVGVVSARSSGRAVDLCNTPHLRFDALVLGPSLLDPGLGGLLGRILSAQRALPVLVLTGDDPGLARGSTMTPLSVCWVLERAGCEYSLLDAPWTGPRLHQCLNELLEGRLRTGGLEARQKHTAQDPVPERTKCPSWLCRKLGSESRPATETPGAGDGRVE